MKNLYQWKLISGEMAVGSSQVAGRMGWGQSEVEKYIPSTNSKKVWNKIWGECSIKTSSYPFITASSGSQSLSALTMMLERLPKLNGFHVSLASVHSLTQTQNTGHTYIHTVHCVSKVYIDSTGMLLDTIKMPQLYGHLFRTSRSSYGTPYRPQRRDWTGRAAP